MATEGAFPGAVIWLRELDQLRKVIDEGQRTFWRFGEHDKYKFD